MQVSYMKQDFSWAAAHPRIAKRHLLFFHAFFRGVLQHLRRLFQARRVLILPLLLGTIHDQGLLDCGSCRRTFFRIAGVHLVTASSALNALKSSSESGLHPLGATSSSIQQELILPKRSSVNQAGLVKNVYFPVTAGVHRLDRRGMQEAARYCEEGCCTTVHSSPADRGQSEYAALADAESAAPCLTRVVGEAHSMIVGITQPGKQVIDALGNIFDERAPDDTPFGKGIERPAGDHVLGQKYNISIRNAVEEGLVPRRLHLEELQARWRSEETGFPLLNGLHSGSSSLADHLSMSATALPGHTSHHKVAGQSGKGLSGGAAEQEPSHLRHGLFIGIVSCFVGAFCGSLGDNMVRKSFVILSANDKVTFFQMWRSPLWSMGMFLTIVINTLCSVVGLAFAPATVVTSFAGVHIFWNTLLAKIVNREKATVFDYVGIVAVILGIVLIVVFSGGDQAISSAQAFVSNLAYPGPVAYIVSVAVLVAVGSAFDCCPTILSYCRNVSASSNGNHERGASLAERFLLAVTSGACGGLSNLLAKATILLFDAVPQAISTAQGAPSRVSLLRQKYAHVGWDAWLMLALTGGVAAAQLLFLNASLRKYEAIYVVPIINSVLIVMGALGGIVLFREIPAQCAPFTLGLVSVVVGVTALSYGKYEAEQCLLQESQRKETALRNIGGKGFGDPLLVQQFSSEVPLEEHRRVDPHGGNFYRVQKWCDRLFRPLTDASVNILVRTNTLNSNYPVGLLNIAHSDSNASIRLYRQTTTEV